MRHALTGACALLFVAAQAQDPQWTDPPKLVVGIVVDQMRVDNIYRYWDNFSDGGFKRLVREGSFQRDAHYDYVPTFTAPGHTSIYTGTTPAHHGIVSNYPYVRGLRRSWYCAKDTTVDPVGTADLSAQRSPYQLLASTLADELELRTDRRSRTVGIALKDRSAIMPIGRTGDASYWYVGGEEGKFVSSSWYMKKLPAWLDAFNQKGLAAKYLDRTWELSLPRDRYHTPLPDDNPYEEALGKDLRPTLPVDLAALRKAGADLRLLIYTPWGNTLTTDMAIAAIAGDSLGMDVVPDLLALSYSSPDELDHMMGQRSIEGEDIYVRLDADLARLLSYLDEHVGTGEYTVFLTGDHGGADVPAYLRDLKGSAGYTPMAELQIWLGAHGFAGTIDTVRQGQVYLKADAPKETAEAVAHALSMHPAVACAVSGERLQDMGQLRGIAQAMARGYMPQRCGDVLFSLHPGYFEAEYSNGGVGTEHGTAWNYDTQVPVVFFGKHVVKGEVMRRTSITDIAPTVSTILGMALPNAADGRVVPEAISTH
ncbi:MAG: alkaline phosphatase family protein [Flavobacteriales bacterium]|jgi:predicted AlkP superfamily pyrophosphatase or phosphodiesterase|nr:alkaline phosphatase family protein [Flavobacteriales bacterium]